MMNNLKSAYNKMLLASNKPGTIRIKRFSNSKFNVKRFSEDGKVLDEEVVIDADAPVTEEIAESAPSEDVVVFSDSEEATDEIVMAVDGGSTDEVVEEKKEEDFVEDTKQFASSDAKYIIRVNGDYFVADPNNISAEALKRSGMEDNAEFNDLDEANDYAKRMSEELAKQNRDHYFNSVVVYGTKQGLPVTVFNC